MNIQEPTSDECSEEKKVFESDNQIGFALWYPQMGGYVGVAVAVMDKNWETVRHGRNGGCIDVYVWHDGEFPFGGGNHKPIELHHCDPEQFIAFGQTLLKLNELQRKKTNR